MYYLSMKQEAQLEPKVPELHFRPEGYVNTSGQEFLAEFMDFIESQGFNPSDLVFSGFGGSAIIKDGSIPRPPFIFIMNHAAWKDAASSHGVEPTPADYADGQDAPCIGLYDKNQLVHTESYDIGIDPENYAETTKVENIDPKKGELLSEIPADQEIKEVAVHKDYPASSPSDALVGLVFVER